MSTQPVIDPTPFEIEYFPPSGEIIARDVSYEDFLNGFDDLHVEWVDGLVILMPGIDKKHNDLTQFFILLFTAFLEIRGGGRLFIDPMIVRLPNIRRGRAPDIQVILPANIGIIQQNEIVGVPDLIVEIVSPGSQRRDRVEKFREYESSGVPEYWIFDPQYNEALFFQLGEDGFYERIQPDEHGIYHSKVLEKLTLPVELLWREKLPGISEVMQMVQKMLKVADDD